MCSSREVLRKSRTQFWSYCLCFSSVVNNFSQNNMRANAGRAEPMMLGKGTHLVYPPNYYWPQASRHLGVPVFYTGKILLVSNTAHREHQNQQESKPRELQPFRDTSYTSQLLSSALPLSSSGHVQLLQVKHTLPTSTFKMSSLTIPAIPTPSLFHRNHSKI